LIDRGFSPSIQELPAEYLSLFSELKNPPKKLFYLGNPELLKKRKIAIVGSRRASQYARNKTVALAAKLASRGAVVVSGAALGVDACAHTGAGESTIAVFGNSLDILYPAANKLLIEKIYSNSLALSEYEKTQTATNYSFVLRNRLVVAMSEAVVIAEADSDSGSMRSAEIALKLGIPIFVLPHRLDESSGTMGLVAKGQAKLIYNIDEFLDDIGFQSISISTICNDKFLEFCIANSSYDEVFSKFGDKIFEYELEGKIEIKNNRIIVKA
jgi:DNA processing protein